MLFNRYADTGVHVAVDLVNRLTVAPPGRADPFSELAGILAVDPPSVAALQRGQVAEFHQLAVELHRVFLDFGADRVDTAAGRLNVLLAAAPAHPHLALEDGVWRIHHHPSEAPLVSMWTSICAEALGRLLSDGHAERLGSCADARCGRVFVDTSRNGTRRHCSTTCQNRMKTAALRRRRQP